MNSGIVWLWHTFTKCFDVASTMAGTKPNGETVMLKIYFCRDSVSFSDQYVESLTGSGVDRVTYKMKCLVSARSSAENRPYIRNRHSHVAADSGDWCHLFSHSVVFYCPVRLRVSEGEGGGASPSVSSQTTGQPPLYISAGEKCFPLNRIVFYKLISYSALEDLELAEKMMFPIE